MNWGRVFATAMLFGDLAASGGYAMQADWRRALYWLVGAIALGTVTF